MKILGISCYYHDSAACLVDGDQIIAAAQEERFTRKKHDEAFPANAVRYCLGEGGVSGNELDAVAFYDKPILKFHRIVETYFGTAPKGLNQFMTALPIWMQDKLWIEPRIRQSLLDEGIEAPETIHFSEHHESHAASAFYPSPFDEAAILTIDGVGEWATSTIGVGEGSKLRLIEEVEFPHSLGLLYSAFTYYVGFRVNSGEYKLMGLAPYGEGVYTQKILNEMMDLKEDGSFRLDLDYFGYLDDLKMITPKFEEFFGGPAREPETPITRREMDVARSIQEVTEEVMFRMARHAREVTGKNKLCLAGGVALNCVANGKLAAQNIFDDIWIQPAAGDAGGAVGAALCIAHNVMGVPRSPNPARDSMQGSLLGPEFSDDQIRTYLDQNSFPYTEIQDEDEWAKTVGQLIDDEKAIGLFQGRMEFGPRALGNRSIIGDARSPTMQSILNLKIKYRESFRPFAPACLAERIGDYFDLDRPSPYMLLVAPVKSDRCIPYDRNPDADMQEWVNEARSDVPAITHVDFSARIQSVEAETNPRLHKLISAFDAISGCGLVINTSFNVRGEPIVCTPEDAYRCFMRTEMDNLCLGSFVLHKDQQPTWRDSDDWREALALD